MLNLPNILTLIRLGLIPVFVVLFYWPTDMSNFYAAIVFVIAALTDLLDGYLARKLQKTTKFGAFLDPVADKIIVCTALVLIVEHYSLYRDVLYPHLGKFITIPAIHPNFLTAYESSGVGLKVLNLYVFIPFAFKHKAACSLNSGDIFLESNAIATPLFSPPCFII